MHRATSPYGTCDVGDWVGKVFLDPVLIHAGGGAAPPSPLRRATLQGQQAQQMAGMSNPAGSPQRGRQLSVSEPGKACLLSAESVPAAGLIAGNLNLIKHAYTLRILDSHPTTHHPLLEYHPY